MAEQKTTDFNKLTDGELTELVDDLTEQFYHTENALNEAIGHAALRGLVPTVPPANVVSLADYRESKFNRPPNGAA